jgi:hypothetical protein
MKQHPMTWEEYLLLNCVVPFILAGVLLLIGITRVVIALVHAFADNLGLTHEHSDEQSFADTAGKTLGLSIKEKK